MGRTDAIVWPVHREGFSLLFYGFGSKKALLEDFAMECLTDGGVVVFNGYMHSMNIREILLKVASLLRVPRYTPPSMSDGSYAHATAHSTAVPTCSMPVTILCAGAVCGST